MYRIRRKTNKYKLVFWAVGFGLIGLGLTIFSQAATTIEVDTSLPVPKNVQAYGDDRTIIVTWEGSNNSRVVGYYITYRRLGSTDAYTVRQSEAKKTAFSERVSAIQLQPVENGVTYEINVQSASGFYENHDAGSLTWGGTSTFARGDGKVSNKISVTGKATSARVDNMRSKYTGFFDDFNTPAGPFNEQKWNTAANGCVAPGKAAAFINGQFHSHNITKSDGQCDRAGIASRPRAVFDMTGMNEQNPAEVAIDIDGVDHQRDTWYLDVMPLSSRNNNLPVDITSHNDINDDDAFGPGNMVRINARTNSFSLAYYDTNQIPRSLNLYAEQTACGESYQGPTVVRYSSCNWSTKTSGLSPIEEPRITADTIANVRRHWVVRFTPTKIRIFVDSVHIASADIPADFVAAKKYTVHSTVFSYNTGKETREGVVPSVQLIHWDNLGFTGPKPTEIIYNYLEGQETGNKPAYSTGTIENRIATGNRTTIIPVPDQIGSLVNGKGRFYFSTQPLGFYRYNWSPNDHILFNGTRYSVPSPTQNANSSAQSDTIAATLFAFTMLIDGKDIKQGQNTVQFVLNGDPAKEKNKQADVFNVHLELPYLISDTTKPSYTDPLAVFGDQFRVIVEPALTNCDMYRSVEQDLGLPYETGKKNLKIGVCELLSGAASQHNHTSPTTVSKPGRIEFEAETYNAIQSGSLGSDTNASGGSYINF